jgi:HD-GYP domain-containing protein (c-di-GMP phosphodiesterase class II)
MERLLRGRLVPNVALIAASGSLPAAILHNFVGAGEAPIGYTAHFFIISASALVAGCAAFALTVVGAKRNDGRTVLVGAAFTVMTGLLAVHGVATEEVLIGENGVSPLAGAAALPLGGAVLALSALPSLRRPQNIRRLLQLQAVLLVGILALGAFGMAFPEDVPAVPGTGSPMAVGVLVAGLVFYGALTLRAVRTYVLTRRWADLSVVVGTVWLGAALFPYLLMTPWSPGWWTGHALELLGIALVGGPVALDLHRGASSRPLAGDLRGAELVAAEESFLGPRVRALMLRLAGKDAYTEGHTRRVALRAVQVGEELGLSAGRLRDLAIGGLLHDIGKLSVPDGILQKPGPLDDDEYEVIRRHPEWGDDLIEELGGFSVQVRRLVLDHHERLDGGGYPRGLRDAQIDLETRILTVCDVYDALISTRVYRHAWDGSRALALLQEESGSAFDPRCVETLERVLARERAEALDGARPAPAGARAAAAPAG